MIGRGRERLVTAAAVVLPLFALAEVNYPNLRPQSQLAIFALLGFVICFLREGKAGARPMARRDAVRWKVARWADISLAALAVLVCGYIVVQTEPALSSFWSAGASLGDRAGAESRLDLIVGFLGLLLVLEATRRAIGWVLPALALAFILYARFGAVLPDWLLPHRGYDVERIVAQAFLHSQGVFGIALRVMFTYVFLFVIFGAILEITGATAFIVGAARRLFAGSVGGAAKVSVMSSGLMGSLSGSAVANTATTGTFTIPLMRSSGFSARVAAGIEAAASSGGALVPPVMGAGAYMMLEIISPPVTYLEIVRAALLPALLYYFSLFAIVHFSARGLERGAAGETSADDAGDGDGDGDGEAFDWLRWEGVVFVGGLGGLIAFLLAGFSVFRAVTLALAAVLVLSLLNRRTRPTWIRLLAALRKASNSAVPLVTAAACVGIVIGIVTLTGAGTRLPALILPLAEQNLLLALILIMISSIVLGMGLPSAVCYLLMATLIGPILGQLGVVPLAAHLFIFYFGMMSMVTPPVALAAYAASSIAGSKFIHTSYAAFRFALVGFTLPFLFVFRPALLMLDSGGGSAGGVAIFTAVAIAVLGILPLAAAIAGHLLRPLAVAERVLLLLSAGLALFPGSAAALGSTGISWLNLAGVAIFALVIFLQKSGGREAA